MDAQIQQRITTQNMQLRQCQNRLTDLERSLAFLRAKRTKTEEALYVQNKTASGCESDRQQNTQSAAQMCQFIYVRLAQGYADSFTRLFSGSKSSNSFYALDFIGASLQSELDRLNEEIRKKEAEINSLGGQINLMRRQINALYMEA